MPRKIEPGDTELGNIIRRLRREKEKSQESVAGDMGIGPKADKLRGFERGDKMPTLTELAKFCVTLDLPEAKIEELLGAAKTAVIRKIKELRHQQPPQKTVFDIAKDLSRVKWFSTHPVIDIKENGEEALYCEVNDFALFYIAPPRNIDDIIKEILEETDKIRSGNSRYRERYRYYQKRFDNEEFHKTDIFPANTNSPSGYEVFNVMVCDTEVFEKTKRQVLKDFLAQRKGFNFNGTFFGLSQMKIGRRKDHGGERAQIDIELHKTDFYTYRILAELAPRIWEKYGLKEKLAHGFSEYLVSGFQKNIHLGVGLAIIIHTLKDNRVIITRRSANATNEIDEAGKYFLSVNEGLMERDINEFNKTSIDLYAAVKRGIEEEIAGRRKRIPHITKNIARCAFTGSYTYLPNLGIDLCFYVSFDCSSKDVRDVYPYARDGQFETIGIISEEQWDRETELPEFGLSSLQRFIAETIQDKEPYETWDEGALIALILSTLAV